MFTTLQRFDIFTHNLVLYCPADPTSESSSQDLSSLPDLTFAFVEKYAQDKSGCQSTTKAYKFFAEPGYLHDIKGKSPCIFVFFVGLSLAISVIYIDLLIVGFLLLGNK